MPRLCYKITDNVYLEGEKEVAQYACLNWHGGNKHLTQKQYDEIHLKGKSLLAEIIGVKTEHIVLISELDHDNAVLNI